MFSMFTLIDQARSLLDIANEQLHAELQRDQELGRHDANRDDNEHPSTADEAPIMVSSPRPRWKLDTIPVEIFLHMAIFLLPAERACLAMASHYMFDKLGRESLRLDVKAQYAFFQHLYKDGMFLPDVLCPLCRVFHSPFRAPLWHADARDDIRWPEGREGTAPWGNSHAAMPYLPPHINFNMVAAVMKCHQHSSEAILPADLDSSIAIYDGGWRIHVYNQFRIHKNRLLLKTERLLLLRQVGLSIMESISQIFLLMREYPVDLSQACRHIDWPSSYPVVFNSVRAVRRHFAHGAGGQICSWDGPLPCFECTRDNIREYLTLDNFLVTACVRCYTDHSLGFVILPNDLGTVCVMTTWKDLGDGQRVTEHRWQSHGFAPEVCFPEFQYSRKSHRPRVYRAFEGMRGIRYSRYRPTVSRTRIEELREVE